MYCAASLHGGPGPEVWAAGGWSLRLQDHWFDALILRANAAAMAKDRKSFWLQDPEVSYNMAFYFCRKQNNTLHNFLQEKKAYLGYFPASSPMHFCPRPASISWVKLKPIEVVASDRNSIMPRGPYICCSRPITFTNAVQIPLLPPSTFGCVFLKKLYIILQWPFCKLLEWFSSVWKKYILTCLFLKHEACSQLLVLCHEIFLSRPKISSNVALGKMQHEPLPLHKGNFIWLAAWMQESNILCERLLITQQQRSTGTGWSDTG